MSDEMRPSLFALARRQGTSQTVVRKFLEQQGIEFWREHFVYILRDSSGSVLYVGTSHDPDRRFLEHSAKDWWARVYDAELISYGSDKDAAYAAEREAIAKHKPPHNAARKPRSHRSPARVTIRTAS